MEENLVKLDRALRNIYRRYLEKDRPDKDARYSLSLRYQGNLAEIEALGFATSWNEIPGMATGVLDLADLPRVVAHPDVIALSYGEVPETMLQSSARDIRARATSTTNIGRDGLWHVDEASGTIRATGGADGTGVIVGIIDTGIDVSHPSFMSSLSPNRTRILRIWDQGLAPDPAQGEVGPNPSLITHSRTYGVQFDSNQIERHLNQGIPAVFRHRDCVGHGTHVAAIAAGNGSAGAGGFPPPSARPPTQNVGIAPRADIVVVKLIDIAPEIRDTAGTIVSYETRFRDAIIYLLRLAEAEHKPVVINCSLSDGLGPHDGLTKGEDFLDRLFSAGQPHYTRGIAVFSAGNRGSSGQHAQIIVPSRGSIVVPFELYDKRGPNTTRFIQCRWRENTQNLSIQIWYGPLPSSGSVTAAVRTPTEPGFSPAVALGNNNSAIFDGNKQRILSHDTETPVTPHSGGSSIQRNSITLEVVPNRGANPPQHRAGIYEIEIHAPPNTVLHAWCHQFRHPVHGFKISPVDRLGHRISSVNIKDDNSHQIGSCAGARNVITVAAYDDKDGDTEDPDYRGLTSFSSRGPLVDYSGLGPYADKPDISAPGFNITSALSGDEDGQLLNLGALFGNRFCKKHGTSMSAPHITGLIALMKQRNPNLTVDQVRAVFKAAGNTQPGTHPPPADASYADNYGAGIADTLNAYNHTP